MCVPATGQKQREGHVVCAAKVGLKRQAPLLRSGTDPLRTGGGRDVTNPSGVGSQVQGDYGVQGDYRSHITSAV